MSTTATPRRAPRKAAAVPQEDGYVQTLGYFAHKAGLTLETLADRSGISRENITGMIRGRLPISTEDALLLGRVLQVPAEELRSGPAGPIVSGSALLSGAVLTKADVAHAKYELGQEDKPPAGPRTFAVPAPQEVTVDKRPWTGRTTWEAIFGDRACGYCRGHHGGVCTA